MQKERELKLPFMITDDGDIMLTEELDREDKDMVSGGQKEKTFTHTGRMMRRMFLDL